MKSAGDLVALAAEFSACVQNGKHYLRCRNARFMVYCGRNAASVILDRCGTVRMQGNGYAVTVTSKCLVDGVIDYLVDEMVESSL